MTEDELLKVFRGVDGRRAEGRRQVFRLGDTVRVKSGPFASFTGTVAGINQARQLLKVVVTVFGHRAPLKLGFADVENITGT